MRSGSYLVTFGAVAPYVGYLKVMQPPAGPDTATATELALGAASEYLALPDWVYAGGSNPFEVGVPVSFLIFLAPCDYQAAASYCLPDGGSEEIMVRSPLTVTDAATPAAATTTPTVTIESPATVTLEMTDDLRYLVNPGPVPA